MVSFSSIALLFAAMTVLSVDAGSVRGNALQKHRDLKRRRRDGDRRRKKRDPIIEEEVEFVLEEEEIPSTSGGACAPGLCDLKLFCPQAAKCIADEWTNDCRPEFVDAAGDPLCVGAFKFCSEGCSQSEFCGMDGFCIPEGKCAIDNDCKIDCPGGQPKCEENVCECSN